MAAQKKNNQKKPQAAAPPSKKVRFSYAIFIPIYMIMKHRILEIKIGRCSCRRL
jgi:hypothetical protein